MAKLVQSATLVGNELLIRAGKTALSDGLQVEAQGQMIALTLIDDLDIALANLPLRRNFDYPASDVKLTEHVPGTDEAEAAFKSEAHVNLLSDWALENGQTLQIKVDGAEQPRLIEIAHPLSIAATEQKLQFEAYVAAHRCKASLVVTCEKGQGADAEEITVKLDPRFTGGRQVDGYQKIALPLPHSKTAQQITIQIKYDGYRPDGSDNYPYLFIANARVVSPNLRTDSLQPRQSVITTTRVTQDHWYRAHIPLFRRAGDASVTFKLDTESKPIFAPIENSIELVDDYGHALVLKAEKPQAVMIFVDGKPLQEAHIGIEDTFVRLPAACLCGEVVDISIRDMSGSHDFLSLPVLAPRLLTPHEVMVRETRAPYPTDLTIRANHRYRALRAHLDKPVPGLDPGALATAFATLDLTFETLKLKPIAFPKVDKPTVSVIIPAHNKVEVTYYGLCALLAAHNTTSFEVILVDDASTDETAEIEGIVSGITVIRNIEPQRFIRACNAGVAAARGEYVVLLNNDTEPTVGWLDALCDAFVRFDSVGLVGSKLLYPDGKLQDAGGIIWGSGNPWNYGNHANPWEPRFCYARQVDYLSGAAMMTTKAIWDEIGGLSEYLEPMYFEDTDFAFKAREAGYTTWFVPSSIVYHFEGMTSGTDVSSGFKSFQEVNRPKFKRRWARDYAQFGREGHEPDLEKDRGIIGRVLFIDYTTPREDRDAGSYAAHREIELVQSLGYKVTFLPQNLAHFGSQTDILQNKGVEVITAPFYLSVPEFLEKRAAEFDAVYITRYYVAQDSIPHIRRANPKARIILNNADLHFLRELRAAISEDDQSRLAAMRRVRDEELEMMRNADLVLSYNEVEHAVIASHTEGKVRVMTCPWVVDIPDSVPPLKGRAGLSFLGSFNHHPNAEAVRWFAAQVMPRLKGAHLSIYGAGMKADITALASDMIDPVGYVETVADAYHRHRIFVAPLLSGAGIKGKVLGAIAHGIPCVLSPVAAEGTGLRHGHDCLIAETPQDWAEAITRLSTDDALWTAMSTAARTYAAERFSFARGRTQMKAAFEAVDLFGAV
ncbi:glycosyltransferase [Roseicyclus sp.]|uniref:glycosyltransferase n=1 Tax=Roseicyclus sp. TaxID=1914329 RepID=UPI003F6BCAB2